jgi:uncharacterized protein (DUF1499 family)
LQSCIEGFIGFAAFRLLWTVGSQNRMPRRRIYEAPTSRLAIWARRLAIFSLPVALLAIIIERAGLLEIVPVLVTFGASLALAAAAVLVALAAMVVIWIDGRDGAGYAFTALAIGLMLLAYPAYLGVKAYRLPAIYDVTTDPYDPPRFEAAARLRTREANAVAYSGLATYQRQKFAYPDIEPLAANVTAQAAYDAALAVVTKRNWRIVDARSPLAGRREGHIEAVARTPVMGFRDDVVIRVRPAGGGARIDIRSASRYGMHDFGANASRVTSLIEDIDDAVTPEKPEQPVKKPQKAAKAPAKDAQPVRR